MGQPPQSPPDTFAWTEALLRERRAVHGDVAPRDGHPDTPPVGTAALCLSGGGIRSAAFCLGVMQALARAGLLRQFHYLSTISGGGYIGGWLQAWLLEHARANNRRIGPADIAAVERQLGGDVAPEPLQRLRAFTSFLTPHAGIASQDTWAGIVLWLRNVLINWAIFMPALFALALLPGIYRDWLLAVPDDRGPFLLVLGLVPAGIAALFVCSRLPSHAKDDPPDYSGPTSIWKYSGGEFIWALLTPLAVAPFICTIGGRALPTLSLWDILGPARVVPLATLAMLMLAYLIAWTYAACTGRASELYWYNLGPWLLGCLVACVLLGAAIAVAAALLPPDRGAATWLAIFGPAVTMLSHLFLSATFVALRKEVVRGDLDREWLARLSAIKLAPVLVWAALAASCLLFTDTVIVHTDYSKWWWKLSASITTVSGVAGAVLGKSSRTSVLGGDGLMSLQSLTTIFALLFAAGLLGLLASGGQRALDALLPGHDPASTAIVGLILAIVSLLIGLGLGGRINVNRFSLHGVYRNRLTRAFLGSVRATRGQRQRVPEPFTDFDPADNFRLADLAPHPSHPRRLFPVIGTALNLVDDAPTAWQERMAAPFTITPDACGSVSLKLRDSEVDDGCFVTTRRYAGIEPETPAERWARNASADKRLGMSMGTAMALSGAAVSPNMGYNTSPWTAFLMTLFNVRLGAWLPNPSGAKPEDLGDSKPPNALLALAREMLALTGRDKPAIYLSDGGHFDNLGLYEMIRRRCQLIVVIDAGEDPDFKYADLSGALRKIRIDMNVDIDFPMPLKMSREETWTTDSRPFALADISWRGPDAVGKLLYIKPCRLPGMPADVRGYALSDDAFPYDSTVDQFFTESRFESYRKLGRAVGELVASDATLTQFVADLRAV
jgi:hypothetical protein